MTAQEAVNAAVAAVLEAVIPPLAETQEVPE